MTCASCVRRVEKELSKVPWVSEASVKLATEKARVVFDPSAVGLDQLSRAVEKASHKVGTLPAAEPATNNQGVPQFDEAAARHERERQRKIKDSP